MRIGFSHFELKVRDLPRMEDFYTRVLGFVVTDRSPASAAHPMVFLSADHGEHHQVVLSGAGDGEFGAGSVDHLAFRVDGLGVLRQMHALLESDRNRSVEAVSHGTTWSIYFRDPEGNRLELFADTPWHVAQPLRFLIDLSMSDEELIAWTEARISALTDFQPAERWFRGHRDRFASNQP